MPRAALRSTEGRQLRVTTAERPPVEAVESAIAELAALHPELKVPWLVLPKGARAFETIYKLDDVWSRESRERLRRNAG